MCALREAGIIRKMNYKTGIIIGRFQPFHKGHAWLIKKALKQVQNLVIGIGSTNVKNGENGYSFSKRKKMVQLFVNHEKLNDRVIKIISVPDDPSDDVWRSQIIKQAGEFDVVIGNNEWVNGIFEKAGYKVFRIGFYRRIILEGKRIRERMKKGLPWEDRVPSYLLPLIKN